MRIVWVVMNDASKPIADVLNTPKPRAAEAKAKEMTEKGKGTHFVHKIKEAMPDDAPGLGAAIPRARPPAKRRRQGPPSRSKRRRKSKSRPRRMRRRKSRRRRKLRRRNDSRRMGRTRILNPRTSPLSGVRSSRLSYAPESSVGHESLF